MNAGITHNSFCMLLLTGIVFVENKNIGTIFNMFKDISVLLVIFLTIHVAIGSLIGGQVRLWYYLSAVNH